MRCVRKKFVSIINRPVYLKLTVGKEYDVTEKNGLMCFVDDEGNEQTLCVENLKQIMK